MEWTNDLIFEFLNLYQNEPTLWNYTAPEHKNRIDAYEAWCRIKTQLKDGTISVVDIKKKRENLMSTYRRQRRKVIESMETGSGEDDVYKPEWPFYDIMSSFLDDIYNKPKKTKGFEDPLYLEIEEEQHDDENDTQETTEQSATFKTPKLEKNKRKRSRSTTCDESDTRSEEAYNITQISKTESDISVLYCNLLCHKLKGLQESTRDTAMMEIDKIMYNLKQQDNRARNFPNTVYQNITSPSEQLDSSQPSPGSSNSMPSPGSSNSQPSPGETLKREWKTLRDCMRQSLKTVRRGGARWRHHSRMSFLLPHITRRLPPTRRALDDPPALENALEAAREGGGVAGASDDADALELFFASVCAAARRLPPATRRHLQRNVLDALLAAENDAAAARDVDCKTFNFNNAEPRAYPCIEIDGTSASNHMRT